MFGKKQKRINELERKIDCYVIKTIRYEEVLRERDIKIKSLLKKIDEIEGYKDKTLKEIRNDKGLSLKQVAEKVGIKSSAYISAIENGQKNPNLKMIYRLADTYDCTPAQILESITKDEWGASDDSK